MVTVSTRTEKVISQLDHMKADDYNYGLIHADLHLGNVVFEGEVPHPIDFGRCGYGFSLRSGGGYVITCSVPTV